MAIPNSPQTQILANSVSQLDKNNEQNIYYSYTAYIYPAYDVIGNHKTDIVTGGNAVNIFIFNTAINKEYPCSILSGSNSLQQTNSTSNTRIQSVKGSFKVDIRGKDMSFLNNGLYFISLGNKISDLDNDYYGLYYVIDSQDTSYIPLNSTSDIKKMIESGADIEDIANTTVQQTTLTCIDLSYFKVVGGSEVAISLQDFTQTDLKAIKFGEPKQDIFIADTTLTIPRESLVEHINFISTKDNVRYDSDVLDVSGKFPCPFYASPIEVDNSVNLLPIWWRSNVLQFKDVNIYGSYAKTEDASLEKILLWHDTPGDTHNYNGTVEFCGFKITAQSNKTWYRTRTQTTVSNFSWTLNGGQTGSKIVSTYPDGTHEKYTNWINGENKQTFWPVTFGYSDLKGTVAYTDTQGINHSISGSQVTAGKVHIKIYDKDNLVTDFTHELAVGRHIACVPWDKVGQSNISYMQLGIYDLPDNQLVPADPSVNYLFNTEMKDGTSHSSTTYSVQFSNATGDYPITVLIGQTGKNVFIDYVKTILSICTMYDKGFSSAQYGTGNTPINNNAIVQQYVKNNGGIANTINSITTVFESINSQSFTEPQFLSKYDTAKAVITALSNLASGDLCIGGGIGAKDQSQRNQFKYYLPWFFKMISQPIPVVMQTINQNSLLINIFSQSSTSSVGLLIFTLDPQTLTNTLSIDSTFLYYDTLMVYLDSLYFNWETTVSPDDPHIYLIKNVIPKKNLLNSAFEVVDNQNNGLYVYQQLKTLVDETSVATLPSEINMSKADFQRYLFRCIFDSDNMQVLVNSFGVPLKYNILTRSGWNAFLKTWNFDNTQVLDLALDNKHVDTLKPKELIISGLWVSQATITLTLYNSADDTKTATITLDNVPIGNNYDESKGQAVLMLT
jgi:hypothetical protein